MKHIWVFLTKPRGNPYWRAFLLATAIVGIVGIPLSLYFPSTVPLVWLWLVGIPANSPVAPLFPTAFEPLMMEVVKYQPVMTVAIVATAIFVYMEFVNWYVFQWVLSWEKLEAVRDHRWVRWGVKHYGKAPLRTVFVFAATPIPFWVVRALAILHKTPFGPYVVVMAFGRFPRLLLYAWLGSQIQLPSIVLISIAIGTGLLLIAWRLVRRQRVLGGHVLDAPPTPINIVEVTGEPTTPSAPRPLSQ